jgi:hypothetical protein
MLTAFAIALAASTDASATSPIDARVSRYSISGTTEILNSSSDGRFAGGGDARFTPTATSNDGRFSLKSTHTPNAGCEAFPDALFVNGFES